MTKSSVFSPDGAFVKNVGERYPCGVDCLGYWHMGDADNGDVYNPFGDPGSLLGNPDVNDYRAVLHGDDQYFDSGIVFGGEFTIAGACECPDNTTFLGGHATAGGATATQDYMYRLTGDLILAINGGNRGTKPGTFGSGLVFIAATFDGSTCNIFSSAGGVLTQTGPFIYINANDPAGSTFKMAGRDGGAEMDGAWCGLWSRALTTAEVTLKVYEQVKAEIAARGGSVN